MRNIRTAFEGLLAIKPDFLARTLEHMLHTIATTQKLPQLRSAHVRMSNRDTAPLNHILCGRRKTAVRPPANIVFMNSYKKLTGVGYCLSSYIS